MQSNRQNTNIKSTATEAQIIDQGLKKLHAKSLQLYGLRSFSYRDSITSFI